MKIIITIFILLFSLSASSEESLCKEVKSKGEGHWPIPENEFTRERANRELKHLEELINNKSILADYVSVENKLMYLKGYILRKYAGSKDTIMLKEYCSFIENEAYVRH